MLIRAHTVLTALEPNSPDNQSNQVLQLNIKITQQNRCTFYRRQSFIWWFTTTFVQSIYLLTYWSFHLDNTVLNWHETLRNKYENILGKENDQHQCFFFSCVTNLTKLMTAQIDFTANQIMGRLLYPLSDGFLNEVVIYNNEISWKKCAILLVAPRETERCFLPLVHRCGSWIWLQHT